MKLRLSSVLKEHILSELPQLIRNVEDAIHRSRKWLAQLGDARTTIIEQKACLTRVSATFTNLIKAAVDGIYTNSFFGDAMTESGFSKRLRARIQFLLLDFRDTMHREGHETQIVEDSPKDERDEPDLPKRVSRDAFTEHVAKLMRRTRGRELPGTFNPMIIGDLFYSQSAPWKDIVDRYCRSILDATRECVELTMGYVVSQTTKDKLLLEIIRPSLNNLQEHLEKRVETVLRPYQRGHPITYNHYFTSTIQNAKRDRWKREVTRKPNSFFGKGSDTQGKSVQHHGLFSTNDLSQYLNSTVEPDMDQYACSEAIYCMEAYYKVYLFLSNYIFLLSQDLLDARLP